MSLTLNPHPQSVYSYSSGVHSFIHILSIKAWLRSRRLTRRRISSIWTYCSPFSSCSTDLRKSSLPTRIRSSLSSSYSCWRCFWRVASSVKNSTWTASLSNFWFNSNRVCSRLTWVTGRSSISARTSITPSASKVSWISWAQGSGSRSAKSRAEIGAAGGRGGMG